MTISKLVFKNLSSKKYTYTAVGGVRFYDINGNEIDIIGSKIITDTLRKFETDKVLITSTNAYLNGNNYNVGNAFRNDRKQFCGFGEKCYWLSSYDNQTITVEFKDPIYHISKIEFSPLPDIRYDNRGLDQPFIFEAYNETGELIASYNITPKPDPNNRIQEFYTPELKFTKKMLVCVPDKNTVWSYDFNDSKWFIVKDDKSKLTETDFKNFGVTLPASISKEEFQKLNSDKFDILIWTDTEAKIGSLLVNCTPLPKLVVQKTPLYLDDYERINFIEPIISGNGEIKFLISRDLKNWYTWNGNNWDLVKTAPLIYNNRDDIDLVLSEGITFNTLKELTWDQYSLLYSDNKNNYPDKIAFAFAIKYSAPDNNDLKLESLSLNLTPKSFWKDVTHNTVILQGYSSIILTFNNDGTYKVNYQD